MITAETLTTLTTFTPRALERALALSGYTGALFKSAKFTGITNAGQFAYAVTFYDDAGTGELEKGSVFISYDSAAGKVKAEY
jgi:hypothetical protein